MRILVVDGGGREHAIVRALARSTHAPELLCAPALGADSAEARARAYDAAARIEFEGRQMRSDIAARAVERLSGQPVSERTR